MLKSTASIAAFALMITACESVYDDAPASGCAVSDYASLVGTNVAAITLPAGLNHRILGPDDAYTEDHIPSRLNIFTDENGNVIRVTCG